MRQAKTSAGRKEVLLLCGCESQMCMGQERLALKIRYSLAGQDTRLSPERPGLESRWRNLSMKLLQEHVLVHMDRKWRALLQ